MSGNDPMGFPEPDQFADILNGQFHDDDAPTGPVGPVMQERKNVADIAPNPYERVPVSTQSPDSTRRFPMPAARGGAYSVRGAGSTSQGNFRNRLIAAVAGVAVLAGGGYGVKSLMGSDDAPAQARPSATGSPSASPLGLLPAAIPSDSSPKYYWTDDVLEATRPLVLPGGTVAYQPNSSSVAIYDGDSLSEITRYASKGSPILGVTRGGTASKRVVTWMDSSSFSVWDSESNKVKTSDLPSAKVTLFGTGIYPYLWQKGTSQVFALDPASLTLKKVTVPNKTIPIAYSGSSVVSSTGDTTLQYTDVNTGKVSRKTISLPKGKIIRRWIGAQGNVIVVGIDSPGKPDSNRSGTIGFVNMTTGKLTQSSAVKWGVIEKAVALSNADKSIVGAGPAVDVNGVVHTIKNAADSNVLSIIDSNTIYVLKGTQAGSVGADWSYTPLSKDVAVPLGTTKKGGSFFKIGAGIYLVRQD